MAEREAVEEMEHQGRVWAAGASQDAPEQVVPEHDALEQVTPEHDAPEHDAPEQVAPEQVAAQAAVVTSVATGEPRVDAALKLLERLPGLPVSDHAELFEQVHAQLSEVLGELDAGSSGPAGG